MNFKPFAVALLFAFAATAVVAKTYTHTSARPAITGISHLAFYTTNPAAADHYYRVVLGAAKVPDPENPKGVRYAFNATQFIEILPLPSGAGINRLDHIAFKTTNAERMRRYLAAKGWKTPAAVNTGSDGSRWFTVLDPEGNRVQFVQPPAHPKPIDAPRLIGRQIIHCGFLVHSRAAEDTFYRGILGFRPYWFGGMKDGAIDWVSQQTPDSHEWIEYMLVHDKIASGIPAGMSAHELGVLDHFSIGVPSVDAAYKILKAGGRMNGTPNDGHTQIGRDGKGQFNLYDPDGVRTELMNFHATEKPCCSPFTAPDPTPIQ